jgi:hypothetical protein
LIDFNRCASAARFAAADQSDFCALGGKGSGDFLADSSSGSGDDNDLVFELHGDVLV